MADPPNRKSATHTERQSWRRNGGYVFFFCQAARQYAFTNWITGFAEYDYYNFGTNSDNFVCGPVACFGRTFGFPVDIKETKNVFKVGLNFLWGAGPLIGRY